MKRAIVRPVCGCVVAGLLAPASARAEIATPAEMERVCQNWLAYIVHQNGRRAGQLDTRIVAARRPAPPTCQGKNKSLGGFARRVSGGGSALSSLRNLPPRTKWKLDQDPAGVPIGDK